MAYPHECERPGIRQCERYVIVVAAWERFRVKGICRSLGTPNTRQEHRLQNASATKHFAHGSWAQLTVLLHINDNEGCSKRRQCSIMRPIIRRCRNLTLFDPMLRHRSWPLNHRTMVMRRIENSKRPETGITSGNKHEWTIHQPRCPFPLPRFFCEAIARSILASSVTSKPDLCGPTGLLLRRSTRRLDDNIVSMSFAVILHGR